MVVDKENKGKVTNSVFRNQLKQRVLGYHSLNFNYYREDATGPLIRTQWNNTGIKFIVETKGIGKKLQVDAIVLQLSLGMALLKLGIIIVDFLMLKIFPSNFLILFLINQYVERHLYAKEKYMKTEDFSEIDQKKLQKEQELLKRK